MDRQWFVVDWERMVGGGGEGEVFLGRSLDTWDLCAIKVSTSIDRDAAHDQLKIELDRLSRVEGNGVVGLIAWNLDAERPFLVFEFAHAGTLADEMREVRECGRVYHPARAIDRIREVLVSLANVHARGLVHRDVKPANLLRFDEAIKLTDFGTGRSITQPIAMETQAFVGTRMYAAPEQLNGESVDERADLYAVGCILHEMLTGSLPDRSGASVMAGNYPNVLVLPELDQFMASLLAEDKERRPFDALDAVRRVDSIRASYAAARRVWGRLDLGPSPY
jgi:serine/threonine-protein kinase